MTGAAPSCPSDLSREQALNLAETLALVAGEYRRAVALHRPMASAHEGFAVLAEEVHELWDEVRKRRGVRDPHAVMREAIQVAAMAVRLIEDVCRPEIAGKAQGTVS